MEIYVGQDKGQWPKGTRVRKIHTEPGDAHLDGSLGTIVGALGPAPASPEIAEFLTELAGKGIKEGGEYVYWIEWDDIPGIPVAIADYRIEPVGVGNDGQIC